VVFGLKVRANRLLSPLLTDVFRKKLKQMPIPNLSLWSRFFVGRIWGLLSSDGKDKPAICRMVVFRRNRVLCWSWGR